jgi:tetratricopeptide (TPR) repeat protein
MVRNNKSKIADRLAQGGEKIMSHASTPLEVFCSFAEADEIWMRLLETHLSLLKHQGLIAISHRRLVLPGSDWTHALDAHLESASVILLLVSADFMASDYCFGIEMERALARQKAGEVWIIPILVRPVDWENAPFKHLSVLPTNAQPITRWSNQDEAYKNIVQGIRAVLENREPVTFSTLPLALPPLCNIPYAPNPFFTGQEVLLTQLAETLKTGQPTALSQPQAISGLGGIGKTQLAVEYAYRHTCDYQAILWARADTHEALVSGYVALAWLLELPQKNEDDQTIIVRAVERWLKTHREWLLIFDNADDLSLLSGFLRAPLGGHVLLTTRAHAVGSLAQRVEVETMSQEVGALLLLRRAGLIGRDARLEAVSSAQRATACAITKQLGGLPLALDQAGSYLEETQCSLESYLTLYQTHRQALLARRGKPIVDYPDSVATTLALCFEQIKQQSPTAADLLCCCAFLHPDSIPEELFTISAHHLGSTLQQVGCDAFAFNEAIKVLLAYSLIHRDSGAATLSIHRLVQAVILDTMSEAQRSLWRKRVVQALNEVFPERVFQDWTQCERMLPHALVCAYWEHELMAIPEEASSLLDKTGAYLQERAQDRDAELLLTRALAMRKQRLGVKHPDMVKSLNHLTYIYILQAKYEQARSLVLQAWGICEQSEDVEAPERAMNLLLLAFVSCMQGEHKQAAPLAEQALVIYEKYLGPEHPDTARCLSYLACVYGWWDNQSLAESLFERSLSILEQHLGTLHRYAAHHQAECYCAQGKYKQAESSFLQLWGICKEAVGEEHLETAAYVSGLARVYLGQGQYKEAKPLFEQLIGIDERYPEATKYAEMAYMLHGLAKLFQHEGEYGLAEGYYQRALAILEKREGISWLKKRTVQRDYAKLLRLIGHDVEATVHETGHTEGDH